MCACTMGITSFQVWMSSIVLFINLTARASADWLFWLFLQTKFIGEQKLPGGSTMC